MAITLITSKDILKEIGIKSGFGEDNTQRLHYYSVLLDCTDICTEKYKKISDRIHRNNDIIYKNDWTEQIGKDITRNAYFRWNNTLNGSESNITNDLEQIEKLLNMFFSKYPKYEYTQSFDSIFGLFYIISNKNIHIANKMIDSYFHMFKADLLPKSQTFGLLKPKTIWSLLHKQDSQFCEWLKSKSIKGASAVIFALEWYISWFCHSAITDLNEVLRVYDFMIASQNKRIGIYMCIAVLLVNKQKLMENVRSNDDLIMFIKNKEMVYDTNEMISKCVTIMKKERDWSYWAQIPHKTWGRLKHKLKQF